MTLFRSFPFASSSTETTQLSISRRNAVYLLVRSNSSGVLRTPTESGNNDDAIDRERQYSVINALPDEDPFPLMSSSVNETDGDVKAEGRVRIWLKIGKESIKVDEAGGENVGLLQELVKLGIVRE